MFIFDAVGFFTIEIGIEVNSFCGYSGLFVDDEGSLWAVQKYVAVTNSDFRPSLPLPPSQLDQKMERWGLETQSRPTTRIKANFSVIMLIFRY